MKSKNDRSLKNFRFSRREFLKYTGSATGLYLASCWLSHPQSILAANRPRVVSVHDSNATHWDYVTGLHWEFINQQIVNDMVARGIMALTGTTNIVDAWNALIPYQSGDTIAIKLNFNNSSAYDCSEYDNQMDAYPETVNAVIDGLTSMGVSPNNIWITDPSRKILVRFIDRINNPNVQYYSIRGFCNANANTHRTGYVDADSPNATPTTHPPYEVVRPAQVLVDANHLINIPLLKGHGSGEVTASLKNNYGSVVFKNHTRSEMHDYVYPSLNSDLEKSTIADINNNPHLRNKTRVIIGDGLFGHSWSNSNPPHKWEILDNDSPNILFFGIDPVATDSVMGDYIDEEQWIQRGRKTIHSSLHYGAQLGLGVHDHWYGFESKQYSLIDYIHVDLDNPSRLDIDRKIRDFKEGNATEQEVKDVINEYMETN